MTPEEAEKQFGPLLADPSRPQPNIDEFIAAVRAAFERWRAAWKRLN